MYQRNNEIKSGKIIVDKIGKVWQVEEWVHTFESKWEKSHFNVNNCNSGAYLLVYLDGYHATLHISRSRHRRSYVVFHDFGPGYLYEMTRIWQ